MNNEKSHLKENTKVVAIHIIVIALIVLGLMWIFFHDVTYGKFLFFHDEFLPINRSENFLNWFTRNPVDLGSANSLTIILVTFFDRLFYSFAYQFSSDVQFVQKISFFLKLWILIGIPLIGFHKLSRLYKKKISAISIFFISLWYSFNTFTVIYWHGNAFSLTLLISYALAPLGLYYFHNAIFLNPNYVNRVKTALIIFLMSFALYFFSVFVLLLGVYVIGYLLLTKKSIQQTIKNLILYIVVYLPFLLVYGLVFYDMYFNGNATPSITGGETYGNLRGGIGYQLFMWFSWGIYTYWEPRDVFTFYMYYKSAISLCAPVIVYLLILSKIKKGDKYLLVFLSIFLFFLFLIKGNQYPFGEIYVYLIQHIPFFRVFRSPDTKFGFGIVFVIAMMLLLVAEKYKKWIFAPLLCIVVLIQAYPLYSGKAIQGENTRFSSDRVIYISKEYQDTASFINTHAQSYGYIISYPPTAFAQYKLQSHKERIGQDILSKIIVLPFIYLSDSSNMSVDAYKKLKQIFITRKFEKLQEFPVKYIIVRRDIIFSKETSQKERKNLDIVDKSFMQKFPQVFKNKYFTIYQIPDSLPLIQSSKSISTQVNPINYIINFHQIKKDDYIFFNQNYSKLWKLYLIPYADDDCKNLETKECVNSHKITLGNEFSYLWKQPLFEDTHIKYNSYANRWKISPAYVEKNFPSKYYHKEPDGSLSFKLRLYFSPQTVFYNITLLYFLYFLFLNLVLVTNFIKKK